MDMALSPDTDCVVIFTGWLMTICMKSGQYGVAELQARRTLAMCERRYGIYYDGYADILEDMAALCVRTGRAEEAEEYWRQAAVCRK